MHFAHVLIRRLLVIRSGCCGQLGHGTRHDELLPRPLTGIKAKGLRAHRVAAGAYHSAAIISTSKKKPPLLFTWGDGANGRLGLGDDKARLVPNEARSDVAWCGLTWRGAG